MNDPIAVQLLGPEFRARLDAAGDAAQAGPARALRSHVVLRSRFAEDCLADAVARGVTQFVSLGAGLDTFPWRQPAWAAPLRIFEVDQPASQQDKRERLDRARLATPANVTFVPVDFETDGLSNSLAAAGLEPARPVFYSWLGVTPYLHAAAVEAVLRTIAAGAAGSEVVLTYAPVEDEGSGPSNAEQMAATVGELFRSHYTPEAMEATLRACGFSEVTFLTPALAASRYYTGRRDGLPPPRRTSIVRARS